MSKKTIYRLVKEMIKENVICEEKERENSRSHKLYVNESNLLVSVPAELKQFQSAFISLFDKTTDEITIPSIFAQVHPDGIDTSKAIPLDRISQLSEERLSLFFRMIDSILIRSIVKWPKQIQDKENLKKLYHIVFTMIADMLMDIAENHEMPPFNMEYSMQKLAIKRLRGASSLFEYWRNFKNYGINDEIENVVDAIWCIDKEIQEMAYKDLVYLQTQLGFNFKYGSDDWRTPFEMLGSLDSKKE